jgi:hypothetical protein
MMASGVTWVVVAGVAGCALYIRDIRTLMFAAAAAATAAYVMRGGGARTRKTGIDLFGAGPLVARLQADRSVSASDVQMVSVALAASIDAYLRALTPTAQRSASQHTSDFVAHKQTTLLATGELPEYAELTCRTIMARMERVLVRKRLMSTGSVAGMIERKGDVFRS